MDKEQLLPLSHVCPTLQGRRPCFRYHWQGRNESYLFCRKIPMDCMAITNKVWITALAVPHKLQVVALVSSAFWNCSAGLTACTGSLPQHGCMDFSNLCCPLKCTSETWILLTTVQRTLGSREMKWAQTRQEVIKYLIAGEMVKTVNSQLIRSHQILYWEIPGLFLLGNGNAL